MIKEIIMGLGRRDRESVQESKGTDEGIEYWRQKRSIER